MKNTIYIYEKETDMLTDGTMNDYTAYLRDVFAKIIAPAAKGNAEEPANTLLSRFGSVESVFSTPYDELEALVGTNVAVYLKTVAAVASRRKMQCFEFGVTHTRAEVADFFVALYMSAETEKIAVMLKDADEAIIDCKIVSEGTVNASEILPRKILEVAIGQGSRKIILAHNHPMGRAVPSEEDMKLTSCISDLLAVAGIVLEYHVVVAGQEANIID